MTLALQTDSTRVITLAFTDLGKENGGLPGVSQGYHTLSHHGQVKESIAELSIIETFHVAQFSRFLGMLKEIKEPSGQTLLDNTMALLGSGMSNANSHSSRDLPSFSPGAVSSTVSTTPARANNRYLFATSTFPCFKTSV